ncbi:MAG: DUF2065 domain-containing protein [Gammaproteobacteria bacterium]|nr:DUF2065 domain-containing protein [Gammaproteobacteria bacterium]
MMWSILISAIGLLFVFEGILPFLSPPKWRQGMQHMMVVSDRTLRIIGFLSMVFGLGLVIVAREFFK